MFRRLEKSTPRDNRDKFVRHDRDERMRLISFRADKPSRHLHRPLQISSWISSLSLSLLFFFDPSSNLSERQFARARALLGPFLVMLAARIDSSFERIDISQPGTDDNSRKLPQWGTERVSLPSPRRNYKRDSARQRSSSDGETTSRRRKQDAIRPPRLLSRRESIVSRDSFLLFRLHLRNRWRRNARRTARRTTGFVQCAAICSFHTRSRHPSPRHPPAWPMRRLAEKLRNALLIYDLIPAI